MFPIDLKFKKILMRRVAEGVRRRRKMGSGDAIFFLSVKGLERGCECIFRQDEGLRLDEYAAREEVVRGSRKRPMVAAVPHSLRLRREEQGSAGATLARFGYGR